MSKSPLALLLGLTLHAQQAIVNLPSADITPKGKNFLMHETQATPWGSARAWSGTNFYSYGVGRSTELAVTSYNGGSPLAGNFATGVGFKSAPVVAKTWNVKQTFGSMFILNHRGTGTGHFSYTHTSFELPKLETRISAGGFAGSRALFGKNTANFIAGIEQPILHHRFTLLAEWIAGKHELGFFIPGILFHPRKNHFIVAAYKIPNYAVNGKTGIVLEYGLIF